MSIFTVIGRVLRFAADEVLDVVTDVITRRADDDLVDIPDAIDDDFQDLGALENLGQAEPLTPDQQGIATELGQENAERIRMETEGPLQEANPTFQAEPQITINITPEQQAGIDAITARNTEILRNTIDVDEFLSDPTNEAEARAQAALELIRAGRLDEVLANNNLVNALTDGDGEAYIARHSSRRYDDDIVDADFEDIDIANADAEAADAQSINIALRDNPIFQDDSVRLGVEQLRVGGSTNSEIREYLNAVKREYEEARRPVTRAIDATNTEQLRELYAEYKLPIPKTNAEAAAANLIIEADRGVINIGPSLRRNIDVNYLKAHAPEEVYKTHGPTILEAKLAQQASGDLGVIPSLKTINYGTGGLPFYSAAARAAEKLKVPSGSYEKLKKLALKQSGVKAKEFEWSGADEAFEGRTDVTPAELAEYLKQNSNLIREEEKIAEGVMRDASSGGYDDGIEEFLDSQDGQVYIKDYLEELEYDFKESFIYNTNMNKISDLNSKSLDEIAEIIDGVSNGRELAAKYPDGWVTTDEYYSQTKVFSSDEAAANWEWRDNKVFYEQDAREGAENRLNELRVYDTEDFNMTVFGSNVPVADPDLLEYANYFPSGGTDMTETRYVFDDPTGDLPEEYFKAGHFDDSGNVVAHARTAKFPVSTGGTAYHLGEAQSDVQQGMRAEQKKRNKQLVTEGKKPIQLSSRTRDQELFKNNYDSLKDAFRQHVVGSENDLSHEIFGNGIGRSATRLRDKPEALAEYKTIVADFTGEKPEDIKDNHSFFESSKGSINDLNVNLNKFAKYIQENKDKLPEPYTAWADVHTGMSRTYMQKQSDELEKLEASDLYVENTTVGAPMLESTDAWLDMVLRNQLSDAIASGADYLTLPNPQMVKDHTGGDFEGHRQFYGNIAAKNLMNIVKPADAMADFFPLKMETGNLQEDVLGLPLTQDLISGLRQMGLPKYVVPFGGVGYGALGAMAEDEETAAGGGL